MTTALDKALEPYEVETDLHKIALEWGSTEAQALDFAQLHRGEFHMSNGAATHTASGLPATHPDVHALVAKKYPHLLPPVFEVSLADRAFLENNFAARGQLIREIGEGPTRELAKRYGHETLHSRVEGKRPKSLDAPIDDKKKPAAGDRAANPFSKQGWSITKQGSLIKAVGVEKAAQIAAAVGAKIGDTKPNPKF
jgi:hypothetical protein